VGRKGQIKTPFDTFALDATTFVHQGKRWYLWAQKAPDISGNSNLYLCEMANPWTLKGEPVMLSKPEYDWECRGFWVNEGPAVLFMATSCLSAIPPAPPTRTTAWGCCG
jgi:GH43 family beta-xylosidase